MSVYGTATSIDSCLNEFARLLKVHVQTDETMNQFTPLLLELQKQSQRQKIDVGRVTLCISGLPIKARTAGANPIDYLQRNWGAGLLAPSPSSTTKKTSLRATTNVRSNANITTSTTNVQPSMTSNANTKEPDRALIRDAAEQCGGATVKFAWAQRSLFRTLGIPEDTWNGFCAMAVGEFFVDPDAIEGKLKGQKSKIDLVHLHANYRASGQASYNYITAHFGFNYVGVTDETALTAENLWAAIGLHNGTKRMIGLLKPKGGGHAIGLVIANSKYTFFDAEEGVVEISDRNVFWYFLYRYVNHPTKGLLTDFNRVFVATWS